MLRPVEHGVRRGGCEEVGSAGSRERSGTGAGTPDDAAPDAPPLSSRKGVETARGGVVRLA